MWSCAGLVLASACSDALAREPFRPRERFRPAELDEIRKRNAAAKDRAASQRASQTSAKVAAEAGGPKAVITCEEPVHDFGTIWAGPSLKHEFTIKNTGDEVLRITKVKPACGCTIAGPYPRTIEPDGEGVFPFSINTKKIRSRFDKSINIESNDPINPALRLRLRGEVKQYVDVVPSSAHFGTIYGSDAQERVLNITNNTDEPMKVSLGTPSSDDFKFELKEKTPGKAYELRITAEPPFEPGRLQSVVQLDTNVEKQKEVTVYARAMVPERIDVRPDRIVVAAPRGVQSRGLSRVIRVTNYGKEPVKVLDANVDDPDINLTLSERMPGKAYTVLVQMPPNYEPPATGRTITLTLDDDAKPKVEVPIRGRTIQRAAERPRKRPAEEMEGRPAPAFAVATLEGKPVTSGDMKGEVTVLNFFAPNCGFCKKQMPRLEKVRTEYANKGVRFLNISQKMRKEYSTEQVVQILKNLGVNSELVIDHENHIGRLFKATSFPTMVVIGKEGKIDAVNVGNVGDLETRLPAQLDALLAGKPVPDEETLERLASKTPSERKAPEPTPRPERKRANDLVGEEAPDFATTTIDGKKLAKAELSEWAATVLNFFAPNCGFCKKQIPRVEEMRKKFADKKVRFVNVSQKMGRKEYSKDEVVKLINGLGFNGELAIDHENVIGGAFHARGFPTMVVLGKSGKVEAVNVGNRGDLESRLTEQLNKLVSGKSVAGDAQAKAEDKPSRPEPNKPTPAKQRGEVAPGKPAPAFELKTLDGKEVSNAELAKHPATVLNFFAPNCGFCKKQIPRVEEIRKKFADKKVRFVNVSQKMGRKEYSKDEVVKLINGLGFNGELALDHTNSVGGTFKTRGFPTMVVLSKSGNVEAINVGNMRDLEERMTAQLEALVEGKSIPEKYVGKPQRRSSRRPAEELVGAEAPEFTIQTVGGRTVTSGEFAKHPATVLNFVAPNCGYCKRQVPTVEKIRAEYESKGVRFVNIAQTMRKEYSVEQIVDIFKKQLDTSLEIAKDDGNKIGRLYKATSFPTLFVVSKEGKVAEVIVGAKADLANTLKARLDLLLKG